MYYTEYLPLIESFDAARVEFEAALRVANPHEVQIIK